MGLCLSMVPSLDGIMEIVVVADLVLCGGTLRRKVTPLLLPRLGALGPWLVEAIARGVAAAPCCPWGVSIGAPPLVMAII